MELPETHTPVDWLPTYTNLRLFSPEECTAILEQVKQSERLYKAERFNEDGSLVVDESYRNCHTSHFKPGDAVYEKIAQRVFDRRAVINAKYQFDLFPERDQMIPIININRYDGDSENPARIGMHLDVGAFDDCDNRKLSLSILLNDPKEYEGGELRLFDGGHKRPFDGKPVGTAAIFSSFTMHHVAPVTQGVRYSAVVWLRGPRFR